MASTTVVYTKLSVSTHTHSHMLAQYSISLIFYLETNILQEVKVSDVHPEVVHEFGVVHIVGEMVGEGEVAEGHHLFGGV